MLLKDLLLATGYFLDNEYLDEYVELLKYNNTDDKHYTELHHAIPVAFYKLMATKPLSRAEAKNVAEADPQNFKVSLLYKDHCKAHYLLYFCTIGDLKYNMQMVVRRLVATSKVLKNKTIKDLPTDYDLQLMQEWMDKIREDQDSQYWAEAEINFLKANYEEHGVNFCSKALGRSKSSIHGKAHLLGIQTNLKDTSGKHWSNTELAILTENYQKPNGARICATLLPNRSIHNIICKARRLGIHSNRNYTIEEKQFLLENYKKLGAKECAKYLNRKQRNVTAYYHQLSRRQTLNEK